jgi:hypothetical protein
MHESVCKLAIAIEKLQIILRVFLKVGFGKLDLGFSGRNPKSEFQKDPIGLEENIYKKRISRNSRIAEKIWRK